MKSYTVYMHISPNNKRYIGITSVEADRRWSNGYGYKKNEYFYRAIEKYGWDNFQHIIIARGLNKNDACWLEIELIKVWNTTDKNNGYNITLGGEGCNGLKHTQEWKQRQSEIMSGENNSFYGKSHTNETKNKISKNHANVSGKNNPMYGKDWREGKSKEELEEIKKKQLKNTPRKKVICITTGKIFNSIKDASIFYNCNHSGISQCCKGKYKFCGKLSDGTPLIWKYLEDYKESDMQYYEKYSN